MSISCSLPTRRLGICLLSLLLTACAQLDTAPVEGPESWRSHRQQITALENWQLRGRLTVQDEQQSRTLSLLWIQAGEHFDINLSGSLGIGSVRVHGDVQGLTVEQSGEEPRHMEGLAELGETVLGHAFPADNLRFWVRGVMAPDSAWQADWNEYQLLSSLQQDGWELTFDRYSTVEGLNLPGRIVLARPPWQLTFRVSDWQLTRGDE